MQSPQHPQVARTARKRYRGAGVRLPRPVRTASGGRRVPAWQTKISTGKNWTQGQNHRQPLSVAFSSRHPRESVMIQLNSMQIPTEPSSKPSTIGLARVAHEIRHDLPFRIRIVRNEEQLSKAIHIRAQAYERHWPNLYIQLQTPEEQDRNPNSLIFLAEAKTDGQPVGTMRVDTNLVNPLPVAESLSLPETIAQRTLAYVTRLGVKQGRDGSLVKLALFKTLHRYCLAKQLHWMLVGIRPPGDRDYVRLGFQDIFEEGKLIPISSSNGIPVRLMSFEASTAERRWHESRNPLYKFMFEDYHPDIEIFSSVSGMWSQPRQENATLMSERVDIYDNEGLPDRRIHQRDRRASNTNLIANSPERRLNLQDRRTTRRDEKNNEVER